MALRKGYSEPVCGGCRKRFKYSEPACGGAARERAIRKLPAVGLGKCYSKRARCEVRKALFGTERRLNSRDLPIFPQYNMYLITTDIKL